MSTTGLHLKITRTARRVRVIDLAARMGVVHSRVSQIEATAVVSDDAAARYLEALETFPDVATSEPQAAAS